MQSVDYRVEEGGGAVTVCAVLMGGEMNGETNISASTQGLQAIGMLAHMYLRQYQLSLD